jgi:hypothetical protein
MNFFARFLALVFFVGASVAFADTRSIDDVLHNAKRRETVLIAGTVKRSFDLDTVLLADDGGEIAVSFVGVRQDVRPGDAIAVVGRFDGRLTYRSSYGLLNATQWVSQSDPKFAELRKQYNVAVATTPVTPAPGVESRLRALDDLKAKNLVTPEEYREQRTRILNQL